MLKRIVSGIMLTLLLIGMLALASNIQPVKASGTIYIRADGSIDPPTAPIQREGNIYTFTDNIINNSIEVQRSDIIIDGTGHALEGNENANGFWISGVNNVTIKTTNIQGFDDGIVIGDSSAITISENNITNNRLGMSIDSSYNTISDNNIIANTERGVGLFYCSNNVLKNNSIANNPINFDVWGGFDHDIDSSNTVNGKPIYYWINRQNDTVPSDAGFVALVNSYNITVQELELENNAPGLILVGTTYSVIANNTIINNDLHGIFCLWADNNIISGNIISSRFAGIYLQGASQNIISENTVTYGGWGSILLQASSNNKIFHNNFNWSVQVYEDSINVWDDGYPSGGNYWSDYNGTDLYRGSYQNETGSDGLGDTPYTIDTINRDNYPLMKPYPWASHDIGITSVTASKTIVGQGYNVSIDVIMFNYGNGTEPFNVTIYANSTIIGEIQNISLSSKNFTIASYTWNTTGFAKGNYTIWAYAEPVPGETDIEDNTLYSDAEICVTIPGDVDGDFEVTILDVVKITSIYAIKLGDPKFRPNSDIDNDGKITILDVVICTSHYAQKYP